MKRCINIFLLMIAVFLFSITVTNANTESNLLKVTNRNYTNFSTDKMIKY